VECLGPRERRKSSDFSRRRKSCSDVDVRTSSGRLFQTTGAAAAKARSPIVERCVRRPTSAEVVAERSRCRVPTWLAYVEPALHRDTQPYVYSENSIGVVSYISCIFARDSICYSACMLSQFCLSVCLAVWPSHGWISQKRLKLGSCNFDHRVAP